MKLRDKDHLLAAEYNPKRKDTLEVILQKAKRALEKPKVILIRMN